MKKFLFCSFNNISQRHFRNLKNLYLNCKIDVYLPNKYSKHRIFDNELNISYTNDLKRVYDINYIFYDLDKALDAEQYDAVFICTLPPERINIAIKCAKKGFNTFIEKPLSNNLNRVYELQDIVEENKLKCALGFQMRFHPIIQNIKRMVENVEFRDTYRIEVTHSNNINNWTKCRDLSNFYALKSETAGGALMSQLHEIDYLNYLFGGHYPIAAIRENWLNTEVEDNITILSNLESNNRNIPIIINLDFLSEMPRRELTIYGRNKIQTFNLLPKNSDEWNNLFLDEMSAFINSLNNVWQEPLARLDDGITSLEYVMDIINSSYKGG